MRRTLTLSRGIHAQGEDDHDPRSPAMRPEEYRAKQDWLRSNATGVRARSVERELRAWQRELEEQGTTVEAWLATDRVRLGLTPWFVGYHNGRLASAVRHHDRYCRAITEHYFDEDVREATQAEMEKLPPCAYCA